MKVKRASHSYSPAFTLIEIMLVVAILVIAIAISYPSFAKAVHRAPLTQAVNDVMEGCRKARALAILQDRPMELRIYADGHMEVGEAADIDPDSAPAPNPASAAQPNTALSRAAAEANPSPKVASKFSAQLSDTVAVELLDVNFVDFMGADVARVRFFPNGTSDDFTVVLKCDNERRKISLEVVTGLAGVEPL